MGGQRVFREYTLAFDDEGKVSQTEGKSTPDDSGELPYAEITRMLIQRGADVNARSDSRWTPLFGAVYQGHTAVASVLLEAEVNISDKEM
jgi:hypothetical protein